METSTRSRSMAEQDRRKFMQQAQQSFSKNQEAIGGMKRDNDKLRADISILNGGTGIIAARSLGGPGDGAGSTLKRLEEQDRKAQLQLDAEALQRHISYEKLRSEDLEKRLAVVRLETMDCRRTMGGVNIAADNAVAVDKQVRVLENRLDQALVDFNKALASNRALRQSIDNLRGERAVFSDIYRNLEAELHGRKRAMADVIETANRDYEERDALARQLEGLREAAREDSQKYNDQFERLDVMMTKYKAAREQQQQQLMLLQAQRAAAKIKQQDERTAAGMHVAGASQSPSMGGTLGATKDGASSVVADPETGDALQDVIEQLKEGTGVQDLDVLYEQYTKAEEGNFSMYSFVNELNAEREGLEKEVGELKEQLAQCRTESQRHAALKALELELADTEQEHESLTLRTQEHKSTLDLVRVTTQGLFQKLGCSAELAEQQLGTTECTELNVLQFLGLIEQRTNEILFAANAAVQNEQRRSAANREEEERRQRERRANERVARLQAGEAVDDMGDVNDGASDAAGNTSALMASAGGAAAAAITSMDFIGVGPATAPGEVTSVAQFNRHRDLLPNTVGDGDGHGFDDDIDDSKPIDHARLRRDMPELVKKKKKDGLGMKKKKK